MEQEYTLRQMAQLAESYADRALAWTDISNLFARHVYYIRSGMERRDFNELWAHRPDICYLVNGVGFSGKNAVYNCYVAAKEMLQREVLHTLADLLPGQIEPTEKNRGSGEYELHSLINPFIQVAKDAKTAKGTWWSPGIVGHVEPDGAYHAYAAAVIFSADFIREDGVWKIWHLRETDEFSAPLDGDSLDRSLSNARKGIPERQMAFGGMKMPTKAEIQAMLDEGKVPGGRTGEVLRTLYDLPPASPVHNLDMVDKPKTSILYPNRFIDDMVEPYETWDNSMSVLRDY